MKRLGVTFAFACAVLVLAAPGQAAPASASRTTSRTEGLSLVTKVTRGLSLVMDMTRDCPWKGQRAASSALALTT